MKATANAVAFFCVRRRSTMPHFDELHTIEQMTIDTLQQNGWMYIKAADLPRTYDSVLVEPMLRDALVRLNPCIAEEPSRADQVIYRLRSLILSARPGNLIAQNETFKQFIFERNTFPFGKNGKAVPVRFFAMEPDELQENTYVVTDQWIYPAKDGGAKFDLVLLVNGIPLVIGEFKTPVRAAITWLDGAKDMDDYEHARPRRPPEARSHLAFPRLGQIALDGVRRAEAAHDGGPPESDRRHH